MVSIIWVCCFSSFIAPPPPGPPSADEPLPDTVMASVVMIEQGMAIGTIAERRGPQGSTIHAYLSRAIEQGKLEASCYLDLQPDEWANIENALKQQLGDRSNDASALLKPVF